MTRVLDALAVLLFLGGAAAFLFGFHALADGRDVEALYCLVVGALTLKAATELVRPGAAR
jgi:hypothetical protein